MHQKFFEESQNILLPVNELVQNNIAVLDKLSQTHVGLLSELVKDNFDHLTSLVKPQADISKFFDAQQQYWQSVSAKCEKSFEKNCALVSQAQTEATSKSKTEAFLTGLKKDLASQPASVSTKKSASESKDAVKAKGGNKVSGNKVPGAPVGDVKKKSRSKKKPQVAKS